MSRKNQSNVSRFIRLCFADGIPRRSVIVALIVGTILNLINQGDSILGAGAIDWVRLTLTYMVPYFVSTYGAVTALLASSEVSRDSS